MTKIDDAVVERMVALVRDLHADHVKHGAHDYVQDFVARTAAIVAELPHPDFAEARDLFGRALSEVFENKLAGEGPTRASIISKGEGDAYWEAKVVRMALQRGRELERLSPMEQSA